MNKYIAFLRGINVGGNKIIPMKELVALFETLNFEHVTTILASGNILFEALNDEQVLQEHIESAIQKRFGFSAPTQILPAIVIDEMVEKDPFHDIPSAKNIKQYATFLPGPVDSDIPPSPSSGFHILSIENRLVFSIVDTSNEGSVNFMSFLESIYGTDITTRNWGTILKIRNKMITQKS